MILLFNCWELLCFVAYPRCSCHGLASLLSILFFFFSFHCFLQSLALSFQSIDSLALGSPDTKVSFVLLSTCLNGNQRPQLPSSAIFCSVEYCAGINADFISLCWQLSHYLWAWYRCRHKCFGHLFFFHGLKTRKKCAQASCSFIQIYFIKQACHF